MCVQGHGAGRGPPDLWCAQLGSRCRVKRGKLGSHLENQLPVLSLTGQVAFPDATPTYARVLAGDRAPLLGEHAPPLSERRAPRGGARSPLGGERAPLGDSRAPLGGERAPRCGGAAASRVPPGVAAVPLEGATSPLKVVRLRGQGRLPLAVASPRHPAFATVSSMGIAIVGTA